jgi:hypothetical protein
MKIYQMKLVLKGFWQLNVVRGLANIMDAVYYIRIVKIH